MQLEQLLSEFAICKNVCDMFLEKEAKYKMQIYDLKEENRMLKE